MSYRVLRGFKTPNTHRGLGGGLRQLRLPDAALGQQLRAPAAHQVRAVDVQASRLPGHMDTVGTCSPHRMCTAIDASVDRLVLAHLNQ